MQEISIKEARTNLSEIVENVENAKKTYIVTKYGKAKAIISPIKYTDNENTKTQILRDTSGIWKNRKMGYKRENSRYGNIFN